MRLPTLGRAMGWEVFHTGLMARRPGATPLWAWGAPLGVALVQLYRPGFVDAFVALILLVGVVIVVERRPVTALTALIVVMPFHQVLLSLLFRLGLPAGIVRPLGQWKEGLILGVVVAAVRRARREHHQLDRLDALALAYVGLGVLYVLVPRFFIGDAVGAAIPLETRGLGFRADVLYVGLFLAARHLRLSPEERRSITRAFLVVATVVCGLAFVEYALQELWRIIWYEWFELVQYRYFVLESTDPNIGVVQLRTVVAGRELLRAGSVLFLPFALGCYGTLAVAVFAARLGRGAARGVENLGLLLAGTAVLLTITRSAIFGMAVVVVLSLFRRSGSMTSRARAARVRFALIVTALVLVALPAAASLGVIDRFVGRDDYSSNEEHREGVERGYQLLLDNPMGRGLATGAGVGQRAEVTGVAVTESQLLQIGTQLGVVGLGLWVLTALHVVVALRRAEHRAPPGGDVRLLEGTRTALLGLLAAGLFLQIFTEFSLSWSMWILAGVALGSSERELRPSPIRARAHPPLIATGARSGGAPRRSAP